MPEAGPGFPQQGGASQGQAQTQTRIFHLCCFSLPPCVQVFGGEQGWPRTGSRPMAKAWPALPSQVALPAGLRAWGKGPPAARGVSRPRAWLGRWRDSSVTPAAASPERCVSWGRTNPLLPVVTTRRSWAAAALPGEMNRHCSSPPHSYQLQAVFGAAAALPAPGHEGAKLGEVRAFLGSVSAGGRRQACPALVSRAGKCS